MKIAIVTIYDSIINFGSFLQAYAMSKVLEEKGHDVFFIRRMQDGDIVNRFNDLAKIQNGVLANNKIKHMILSKRSEYIVKRECEANEKRFECSLNDWKSIKIISPDEIEQKGIQLILCGSDEIWNIHNRDIDLRFYSCEWVKKIPKLAYAISSGDSRTSEFWEVPEFFESVGDFCTLLPRDKMTQKLIEDITNINQPIVCDPTILLGREGFALTDAGKEHGRYLLVYSYYLTKREKQYIKKYAKQNNLKIISPCIYSSVADEVMYTSALDFPSLIFNAECVYTTTFHGAIFSLMFAKRFCCLPRLPKVANLLGQIEVFDHELNLEFSYFDFCAALNKIVDREKIDYGLECLKIGANEILDKSIKNIKKIGYSPLGNHYQNCSKYYYGYSERDSVRKNSSSGGMFYEFAQTILDDGGIVFGAFYNEKNQQIIHQSTDEVPIETMMRSKYAESKLGDTYKKIEWNLKKGRKVLFCGTPCQAAGLYNLREKWKVYNHQLYIIDFLCEGVPSYKILQEYINLEERKVGKKVKNIDFRSKSYGWNIHCMKINYEDGTVKVIPSFVDSYMHTFIMDLIMNRKSCYVCPFRDKKRSDITIGDFWKVGNADKSCQDNKGVSAIFVNTKKGEELLSKAKGDICVNELAKEKWSQMEQHIDLTAYERKREEFYNEFLKKGYESAIKHYSTYFSNKKAIDKLRLLKIWIRLEAKRKKNQRRKKCRIN